MYPLPGGSDEDPAIVASNCGNDEQQVDEPFEPKWLRSERMHNTLGVGMRQAKIQTKIGSTENTVNQKQGLPILPRGSIFSQFKQIQIWSKTERHPRYFVSVNIARAMQNRR